METDVQWMRNCFSWFVHKNVEKKKHCSRINYVTTFRKPGAGADFFVLLD